MAPCQIMVPLWYLKSTTKILQNLEVNSEEYKVFYRRRVVFFTDILFSSSHGNFLPLTSLLEVWWTYRGHNRRALFDFVNSLEFTVSHFCAWPNHKVASYCAPNSERLIGRHRQHVHTMCTYSLFVRIVHPIQTYITQCTRKTVG